MHQGVQHLSFSCVSHDNVRGVRIPACQVGWPCARVQHLTFSLKHLHMGKLMTDMSYPPCDLYSILPFFS